MKEGKLIIFSAPSGSGKSTIIGELLKDESLRMEFSISATSREPRGEEKNGVEYYFFSAEEFRNKIKEDNFVEWEEVYKDRYYGTLKSEVDRITKKGNNVVFDVDVLGGSNIKKMFGDKAIAIFIQPPSIEELKTRLVNRGTDAPEVIDERIARAEFELSYADKFDSVVINDSLDKAVLSVNNIIKSFIKD